MSNVFVDIVRGSMCVGGSGGVLRQLKVLAGCALSVRRGAWTCMVFSGQVHCVSESHTRALNVLQGMICGQPAVQGQYFPHNLSRVYFRKSCG